MALPLRPAVVDAAEASSCQPAMEDAASASRGLIGVEQLALESVVSIVVLIVRGDRSEIVAVEMIQ